MQTSTLLLWKRCGGLLGLLLVLLLAAPKAQAQTWLVSTDPFVKIGVSDKFGQLGGYTAKFIVTAQNGKEYTLVKQVEKGQNGIDVVFPSPATEADFFQTSAGIAAPATPGNYTWQCEVAGKKVAGGRFTMPTVANDVTVVERPR